MAVPRNVVLVGFMGCGKSTVGRMLGDRLGRPFIDLDQEIEARADCTIAQVFAEHGEAGFRRLEAELCADVASVGGQVIACGGGAMLNAESRAWLEGSGFAVCLLVRLDVAMERLRGTDERPLLSAANGPAQTERIEALWRQRRSHYGSFALSIDTSDRTPEEVVEAAVALLLAEGAS